MTTTEPIAETKRPASANSTGAPKVTAELVRAVSDKVYALLLNELRIERERMGRNDLRRRW